MNWNPNLPKPVARTNTTKHPKTTKHYIIPTITVVFGGAHIRITHFPVEHWTPKHISNGRVRKQFLRDWREPDVKIDNSKQENLANLVKELEAEQKAKHNITEQEKQYNIGVMLQHARVQSYDYKINQAAIEYDINIDMVEHFNNLEQHLLNKFAQYANLIAARKATVPATKKQKQKQTNPIHKNNDKKYVLAANARNHDRNTRETKQKLKGYRGFSITDLFGNNNQM